MDDTNDDKSYGDNVDPRLEPKNLQRNDLAPRGMGGTSHSSTQTSNTENQEQEAAKLAAKLKKERERSLENQQGMYGERKGPFVAKRHFDRSR